MSRNGTRAGWGVVLVLLAFATATAQAATRAWLDRERVELGETATLNIETDQGDARMPDFAALEQDFALSAHSSRSSSEIRNGRRQARMLFAVALKPRREGLLTAPALRVGSEATQPLPLVVVPASTAPARAGAPAFIEGEADTQSPYLQQSIGYTLRLYYASPLVSGQLDQPEPDGASMQRVGSDVSFTRDIDGRRYTVVERRFVIVPERSGSLTIPGARFEGMAAGGFFDDVFGNGRRALRASGAPRILQVLPLPGNAPQPWLPLHGLGLRYLATPTRVRAGEAAHVEVELLADGAAASQLPALEWPALDGAQVFPEPPQVDERFEGGRLQTRVVRRYAIVPARAGALSLAGPRLDWWDVRAGVARVASLPELGLEVAAGSAVDAATGIDAAAAARPVASAPHGRGWAWLALVFAALWLATLVLALRWRRAGAWRSVPGASRGPEPAQAAAAIPLRALREVLAGGDLDQVTRALCALASPAAADLDALAAMLEAGPQRSALARLQQARWGGGDPAAARAALREAFAGGPRWRTEAHAAPEHALLPPLYPGRRS